MKINILHLLNYQSYNIYNHNFAQMYLNWILMWVLWLMGLLFRSTGSNSSLFLEGNLCHFNDKLIKYWIQWGQGRVFPFIFFRIVSCYIVSTSTCVLSRAMWHKGVFLYTSNKWDVKQIYNQSIGHYMYTRFLYQFNKSNVVLFLQTPITPVWWFWRL